MGTGNELTIMVPGTIVANGETISVELPCSITQILSQLNLQPKSVVVELNGDAVVHSQFWFKMVSEGDRLEIVKIVAGG